MTATMLSLDRSLLGHIFFGNVRRMDGDEQKQLFGKHEHTNAEEDGF